MNILFQGRFVTYTLWLSLSTVSYPMFTIFRPCYLSITWHYIDIYQNDIPLEVSENVPETAPAIDGTPSGYPALAFRRLFILFYSVIKVSIDIMVPHDIIVVRWGGVPMLTCLLMGKARTHALSMKLATSIPLIFS